MSGLFSYFDASGRQIGDLFPMSTPAPAAPAVGAGWADVFGQLATGAMQVAQAREQRKLEQSYLKQNQTPPGSMLAPGGMGMTGETNIWPLIALAVGGMFLMSRK